MSDYEIDLPVDTLVPASVTQATFDATARAQQDAVDELIPYRRHLVRMADSGDIDGMTLAMFAALVNALEAAYGATVEPDVFYVGEGQFVQAVEVVDLLEAISTELHR